MKAHWSAHLTLSIVHFMAFPETMKGEGPITETVSRIAEDEFFGGIEIGIIKNAALRHQVGDILEATGLRAAFGAQPALLMQKLDLNASDPAMRARAVDAVKECVDQAADLRLSRLAVISGWDPGPAARGQAKDWLFESLCRICEYARPQGVGITLETFDRTVDKKAIIGPAAEAAEFSARMKTQYADFGLMYDLSHMPLLEEEALPTLVTLRDHLAHIHVGNCVKSPGRPGFGDQHPRFGFPGGENGAAELAEFLRALFSVGYLSRVASGSKPWVGIEVKPQPGETSEQLLATTKRTWIEAWARV